MADKDDRDTSLSGKSSAGPGRGSNPGGKTSSSGKSTSSAGPGRGSSPGGQTVSGKSTSSAGAGRGTSIGGPSVSTAGRTGPGGYGFKNERADTPSSARSVGSNLSNSLPGSMDASRFGGRSLTPATASTVPSPARATQDIRDIPGPKYGFKAQPVAPSSFDNRRMSNSYAAMISAVNPVASMDMAPGIARSPLRAAQDVRNIGGPAFSQTGLDMATRPSLEQSPLRAEQDMRNVAGPTLSQTGLDMATRPGLDARRGLGFTRDENFSTAVDPVAAQANQRTGMPAASLPTTRGFSTMLSGMDRLAAAPSADRFGPTTTADSLQKAVASTTPAGIEMNASPTFDTPYENARTIAGLTTPGTGTVQTASVDPTTRVAGAFDVASQPVRNPITGKTQTVNAKQNKATDIQVAGLEEDGTITTPADTAPQAPAAEIPPENNDDYNSQPAKVVTKAGVEKPATTGKPATLRQAIKDVLTPNPKAAPGWKREATVIAGDVGLGLAGGLPGIVNMGVNLLTGKSIPGHVWDATHGAYGPNQYKQGSQHRDPDTSGDGARSSQTSTTAPASEPRPNTADEAPGTTFEEKYLAFNDPTWRPTPIQKWGANPTHPEYS